MFGVFGGHGAPEAGSSELGPWFFFCFSLLAWVGGGSWSESNYLPVFSLSWDHSSVVLTIARMTLIRKQ